MTFTVQHVVDCHRDLAGVLGEGEEDDDGDTDALSKIRLFCASAFVFGVVGWVKPHGLCITRRSSKMTKRTFIAPGGAGGAGAGGDGGGLGPGGEGEGSGTPL